LEQERLARQGKDMTAVQLADLPLLEVVVEHLPLVILDHRPILGLEAQVQHRQFPVLL
jgi:hypothetical protein